MTNVLQATAMLFSWLARIIRSRRDGVVSLIKRELDVADIEIPFPNRTFTVQNPVPLRLILGHENQETTP